MENHREISSAVIKRLPRYYRYLGDLMIEGAERISSNELSQKMHVTASQIRQDLNNFGGFGQQGYGYNVTYLHEEIGKILGLNIKKDMIIIGSGNFGHALANYENFGQRGFIVKAMFDVSSDRIGSRVRGIPIYSMDYLKTYLNEMTISIAVLTIPRTAAQAAADTLVSCGIKAIWNFAHTDLQVPDDVVVENVHLSESLMQLSYRLNELKKHN